jgi:hypothetical protein
VENKA